MDEIKLTELEKRFDQLCAGNATIGKLHALRAEIKQASREMEGKPTKERHRKKTSRDPRRRPKS